MSKSLTLQDEIERQIQTFNTRNGIAERADHGLLYGVDIWADEEDDGPLTDVDAPVEEAIDQMVAALRKPRSFGLRTTHFIHYLRIKTAGVSNTLVSWLEKLPGLHNLSQRRMYAPR